MGCLSWRRGLGLQPMHACRNHVDGASQLCIATWTKKALASEACGNAISDYVGMFDSCDKVSRTKAINFHNACRLQFVVGHGRGGWLHSCNGLKRARASSWIAALPYSCSAKHVHKQALVRSGA